jgi:hypothetical protein
VGKAETDALNAALKWLAREQLSGSLKATAFARFAAELEVKPGGTWKASQIATSDGDTAFLGRQGEVVVFSADGTIFRGKGDSWLPSSVGITLDYSKLTKV